MANENVGVYEPGRDITGKATAAVTGKRFLKISGDRNTTSGNISVAHADAGGRVCGVSKYDAASGEIVGVARGNSRVTFVTAEGAIAAFQQVVAGTDGKAKAFVVAINEVQVITISGSPSTGTWTASFDGSDPTAGLAIAATAAAVQTALQGLPTIGAGNATVAGSDGGPFTVTFTGDLAGKNVPLLVLAETFDQGAIGVAASTEGTGVPAGYALTAAVDAADAEISLY